MTDIKYASRIKAAKEKSGAVILAHYYQLPEIQDLADHVGDSFALSRLAATLDNEVIVFCGVGFMAESAKLLSPGKTVLLPVKDAGCPMADMAGAEDVKKLQEMHPEAAVVSYVNSTTEVKAHSHICCTSSNALRVIRSLPHGKIIFVPDKNLGAYAAEQVPEKEFILFDGHCPPHNETNAEDVARTRRAHPDARLLVHPECPGDVRREADFIGSTAQIIAHAGSSSSMEFIIGTEEGILHPLRTQFPEKTFHLLSHELNCPDMKKTTARELLYSLENRQHQVHLDENLARMARKPLERMLSV